ncbi:polcalcin Cup a 4-like [Rutidosis leptorrhynchoides]|uniref:polcalcin Cup a 4-like n=1 Tax=Rutidosis leptorrhynchoides TaxID=125765 RepID=UPI003A99A0B2
MKLTKNLNPKHLFRSSKQKKSHSVSRSDSESFSSSNSASSGSPDPTSVLPNQSFSSSIITRAELENVLIRIGASGSSSGAELEEIRIMLNEIDRDGDGSISLNEFESVVFGATPLSDGEIKSAFEFFDTDGDGLITESELFEVFKMFGECSLEDCKRMINGVDKNGDGFVCFADFALMMDQQFQQR